MRAVTIAVVSRRVACAHGADWVVERSAGKPLHKFR
jgi:hypothetical protein